MSSMFDFDDSINLAYNAKMAGKNLVTAKHEVLGKTGDFLFLAHSDREFALRCQMAEADIESAALRKMANVSDSKAKLVRALHEEWKIRHANCGTCKVATPYEFKKVRPSIEVHPQTGIMTAEPNPPVVDAIRCDDCGLYIRGIGHGGTDSTLPEHFVVTQGEGGNEVITRGPDTSHGVTDQIGGTLPRTTVCRPCAEKRAINNLDGTTNTATNTANSPDKEYFPLTGQQREKYLAEGLPPRLHSKTALTPAQDREIDVVDDGVIDEKDFAKLRRTRNIEQASKTAASKYPERGTKCSGEGCNKDAIEIWGKKPVCPKHLMDAQYSVWNPVKGSKTAHGDLEPQILQELEEIEQMMQCMCGASCRGQFNGTPQCAPGEGCAVNAIPGACGQCGQSFQGHDVCSCRGGCAVQWNPSHESVADKVADHDEWAAKTNHGRGEAGPQLFSLGSSTALPRKESSFVVESMAPPRFDWSNFAHEIGGSRVTDRDARFGRGTHWDDVEELQPGGDLYEALAATNHRELTGGTPVLRLIPHDPSRYGIGTGEGFDYLKQTSPTPKGGTPTGVFDFERSSNLIPGLLLPNGRQRAAETGTSCITDNSLYGHPNCNCGRSHLLVVSHGTMVPTEHGVAPAASSELPFQLNTWPHALTLVLNPDAEHINNIEDPEKREQIRETIRHWRDHYLSTLSGLEAGSDGLRPDEVKENLEPIGHLAIRKGMEGVRNPRTDTSLVRILGVTPFANRFDPSNLTRAIHGTERTGYLDVSTGRKNSYWPTARYLDRWGVRGPDGQFLTDENGFPRIKSEPGFIIEKPYTVDRVQGRPGTGADAAYVDSQGQPRKVGDNLTMMHEIVPLSKLHLLGEKYNGDFGDFISRVRDSMGVEDSTDTPQTTRTPKPTVTPESMANFLNRGRE